MEKFKEAENDFIDLILEEITYKNVNFKKLSEITGINPSIISRTFNRNTIPSLDTIFKICEALNLKVLVREK